MATRYVDFVDGLDANAGTLPGAPKKTLTSASTGLSAGDEIRIKYTPKTLLGSCGWVNHQRRFSLPAGLISILAEGIETWVPSANVTFTATAAAQPSPGATFSVITPQTAFTTGKLAYVDLGSNFDLSAFRQLSLKMMVGGTTPTNHLSGVFRVDLCSDALGDVPVNQLTLPAFGNPAWQGLVIDAGVALGASIRSISLHALSDPATSGIRIAQIMAVKAPTAADCINHRSIVSLATEDEPWYYNLDFFKRDTGVDYAYIGFNDTQASDVIGVWWEGVTGTYPTYVVTPPLYTTGAVSVTAANQLQVFGATGTAGNRITVSGGWNAAFDAQVPGEISWVDAINGVGYFYVFTNRNGLNVSRIGVARGGAGFYLLGVKHALFEDLYCTGGSQDREIFTIAGNTSSTNDFSFDVIVRRVFCAQGRTGIGCNRADYVRFEDCHLTNFPTYYGTAGARNAVFLSGMLRNVTWRDCKWRNSALNFVTYGWSSPTVDNLRFIQCTGDGSPYVANLNIQTGGGDQDIQFVDCNFTNISIATHFANQEFNLKAVDFFRCTSDAPLRVAAWPATGTFWPQWASQEITFTAVGGDPDENYSESPLFRMYTSAAGSRLPNGLEWRIQLLSTTAFAPDVTGTRQSFVRFPMLEYIWCVAGQPVTYTRYVKRNSASVYCALYIPPLYGGDEVIEIATTVGGWEALTVNFTPTFTGAIVPEIWAWGSALDYVSFADDLVVQ